MIIIDKTYEIVTEESAENGEAEESGLLESIECSFKELVEMMRDYSIPSCYPASGHVREWLSSYSETDYITGDNTTETIHFSRNNPPRKAKYWKKAMKFAGLIKK